MLSSTSSSNGRLPSLRWGRSWAAALAIALVPLALWEGYWRTRGLRPSVPSRASVWAVAAERVRPTSTVAIGTSRLLAALNPDEWARATGGPPAIHLTVLGGSMVRAIEFLAREEPSFHGLVIGDVVPYFMFDSSGDGDRRTEAMIDAYRETVRSPAKRLEALLRAEVPSWFVFLRDELQPSAFMFRRGWPNRLPPVTVLPNGYAPLHFREVDSLPYPAVFRPGERERLLRGAMPPTAAELEERLARLRSAIAAIQARGGAVALVYMPGCGARRALEDELFPKSMYWDPLLAVPQLITVDFDQFPGAASWRCFDGSHLDQQDAVRFSHWLATSVSLRTSRADRAGHGVARPSP